MDRNLRYQASGQAPLQVTLAKEQNMKGCLLIAALMFIVFCIVCAELAFFFLYLGLPV